MGDEEAEATTAEDESDEPVPGGGTQQPDGERRTIDDVMRYEVMAAIRDLCRARGREGLTREELLVALRDRLGFGALGTKIRKELSGDIRAAVRRGVLDNEGGRYRILCRNIGEYQPAFLREMFLAAIGRGWWDREDAIVEAARFLGFRRTGPEIRRAFKSAINSAIRAGLLERDGPRIRRIG